MSKKDREEIDEFSLGGIDHDILEVRRNRATSGMRFWDGCPCLHVGLDG